MLSSNIPELSKPDDLHYLQEALSLDKTEQEASDYFINLIHESVRLGWSTQLNWW